MLKHKALEIMQVCLLRQETGRSCRDCMHYGEECLQMHRMARTALFLTTAAQLKEAEDEKNRGTEGHA